MHYYFSHSSKDSKEMTAVDLIPCQPRLTSIKHQEETATHSHWIKTNKYTTWFTVLILIGTSIFNILAISNSIQLQKQHTPVYFCYLPQASNNSKIFRQFINQFLLWLLYFPCFTSDLCYSEGKPSLVIKHQISCTQPICHIKSVSVGPQINCNPLRLLAHYAHASPEIYIIRVRSYRKHPDLTDFLLPCMYMDIQSWTPHNCEEKIYRPNPHLKRLHWFTCFWWFQQHEEQRKVSDLSGGSETSSSLLPQLGFTTLTGWTRLFNPLQRGSSFMANRAAFSKSSLNCLATVSIALLKSDLSPL